MIALASVLIGGCATNAAEELFLAELRRAESDQFSHSRLNRANAPEGYRRAVRLGESALGRTHPALVLPLARLGEYQRVLSIYAENPTLTRLTWRLYARARNPFGRRITRQEAMYLYRFGKAVAINGLAAQAEQSWRRQQAESLSREALRILLEIHGPADPILRDQFRILRQYCYQRRDWQCAEDYARRVVELDVIDARRGGHVSDVGSAVNLQSLAASCAQEGKLGEAATLYAEALERLDRTLPQNDRLVVGCLEGYAIVLTQLGREAEADVVRERARRAREATRRGPE